MNSSPYNRGWIARHVEPGTDLLMDFLTRTASRSIQQQIIDSLLTPDGLLFEDAPNSESLRGHWTERVDQAIRKHSLAKVLGPTFQQSLSDAAVEALMYAWTAEQPVKPYPYEEILVLVRDLDQECLYCEEPAEVAVVHPAAQVASPNLVCLRHGAEYQESQKMPGSTLVGVQVLLSIKRRRINLAHMGLDLTPVGSPF